MARARPWPADVGGRLSPRGRLDMPDAAKTRSVETEALSLPEKDRADLARVLLLSLGDAEEPDVEAAWAEEAERRYEELRSGAVEAISSERVFEEARSRLK